MALRRDPLSPYSRSTCQFLPEDPVLRLLQIHKAHVNQMGIRPGPLQEPCESEGLVRSSTSMAETALYLFNMRLDDRPNPPSKHLGVDFTSEAE